MTGKPDTFIQRTYSGVTLFVDGTLDSHSRDRASLRHDLSRMQVRLDESVADGDGDIEYIVCEGVNEHGSNDVWRSSCEFDEAMAELFRCRAGYYLVAVRP